MQIHLKQNITVIKEIRSWLPPWLDEQEEILFARYSYSPTQNVTLLPSTHLLLILELNECAALPPSLQFPTVIPSATRPQQRTPRMLFYQS